MTDTTHLPLVSIMVPCYNHGPFIQDCIQSIIDQDYPNIEFIIIDDGSKDDSVAKIESLVSACQARFTRFEFRHRPNKGLCATLNEMLAWVEGEYVCSLGSDDMLVHNKINIQVDYLQQHPETVAVFGSMLLIDENSNPVEDAAIDGDPNKTFKRHTFEDIIQHHFYIPTPTNMCRTKALKATGGYDESLAIEDWYMWLRLSENGMVLDRLPDTFAYYRRHGDNLSSKVLIMHNGRVETLKRFKHSPLYKKSLKIVYYMALNEIKNPPLSFIAGAIRDLPSFLFSMKFWRKVRATYR